MLKMALILLIFFSGCSIKEYKLFQNKEQEDIPSVQDLNITVSSKIVPNDVIKIDIYNMNQKSNIMMQNRNYQTPYGMQQEDNNYVVYNDGTIILPLLNTVKVSGLTIKELHETLTTKYKKFLNSPYIKATVINHKIFVLGEVNKEGAVPIEGESISLIEALSLSGGLTNHASRNNIRVIREENGKYLLSTFNLNQFETLNTRNLMLKHKSIIYVEPKDSKLVHIALNDYIPILQTISSILSTFLTIEVLKNQ